MSSEAVAPIQSAGDYCFQPTPDSLQKVHVNSKRFLESFRSLQQLKSIAYYLLFSRQKGRCKIYILSINIQNILCFSWNSYFNNTIQNKQDKQDTIELDVLS